MRERIRGLPWTLRCFLKELGRAIVAIYRRVRDRAIDVTVIAVLGWLGLSAAAGTSPFETGKVVVEIVQAAPQIVQTVRVVSDSPEGMEEFLRRANQWFIREGIE